jgi:hypothetical protein
MGPCRIWGGKPVGVAQLSPNGSTADASKDSLVKINLQGRSTASRASSAASWNSVESNRGSFTGKSVGDYGRRTEKRETQTDRFTLQQSLKTKGPSYSGSYGLCYPLFHRNLKLDFSKSEMFHGRSVHLDWQGSTTLLRRVGKKVLTGFCISPLSFDTCYWGHSVLSTGGCDRKDCPVASALL